MRLKLSVPTHQFPSLPPLPPESLPFPSQQTMPCDLPPEPQKSHCPPTVRKVGTAVKASRSPPAYFLNTGLKVRPPTLVLGLGHQQKNLKLNWAATRSADNVKGLFGASISGRKSKTCRTRKLSHPTSTRLDSTENSEDRFLFISLFSSARDQSCLPTGRRAVAAY